MWVLYCDSKEHETPTHATTWKCWGGREKVVVGEALVDTDCCSNSYTNIGEWTHEVGGGIRSNGMFESEAKTEACVHLNATHQHARGT